MNDNGIDDPFMKMAEKVLICIDGINLDGTPVKVPLDEKKQIATELVTLLESGDDDVWSLFAPECGELGEMSSKLIRVLALNKGLDDWANIPIQSERVSESAMNAFIKMEAEHLTLLNTARQIMSSAVNIFMYRHQLRLIAGTDYLNQDE